MKRLNSVAALKAASLVVVYSAVIPLIGGTHNLGGSLLLAEPSTKIGRAGDGRAYRIDSAGNEIVDELAELELSTEDLRFQVRALEEDLKAKEQLIFKLQSRNSSSPAKATQSEFKQLQPLLPRKAAEVAPAKLDKVARQRHQTELTQLQRQLTQLNQQLKRNELDRSKLSQRLQEEQSETQSKAELYKELKNKIAALKDEREALKQRNTGLEENVKDLALKQVDLSSSNQTALKQQQENFKSELAKIKQDSLRNQESLNREIKQLNNLLARALDQNRSTKATANTGAARARLATQAAAVAQPNLASKVAYLQTQLEQLTAAEQERRALYNQYSSGKGSQVISFKLTELATSSGKTLPLLRAALKANPNSLTEINLIEASIIELKDRLRDDLNLIKRLSASKIINQ